MPIIGLTCKTSTQGYNFLPNEYMKAIELAGGIPFLIPCIESIDTIQQVAQRIDGLLLSGGKDVDPVWYGEEPAGVQEIDPCKDFLEMTLTKLVLGRNIPILGICRGAQMLNVVCGGTLHQHLQGLKHYQKAPTNYPTHEIDIKQDTLLYKIIGKENVRVNSFHHQSIKDIAPGFIVSAVAKDGVIEAIEKKDQQFILGLQFHVEYFYEKEPFNHIFLYFVKECQKND